MRLSTRDVDKVTKAIRQAKGDVTGALKQAVGEELHAIATDQRMTAPRGKTGQLVAGITTDQPRDLAGRVTQRTVYAIWIEFGRKSARDAARPYIVPSAESARPRFPRRVVDIVRQAV